MSFRGKILCGIAGAAMLVGNAAYSNTVDLDYQGNHAFGSPFYAETVHRTINGDTKHVWAGLFRLTDGIRDILAFCIQPNVWLNVNEDYSTTATAASADQLMNIDKLYTSAFDQVNSKATAAGFQLALWEIMVETGTSNGFDLGSGDHTVNASQAAFSAGNMFLAGLAGASTGGYDLTTYVNSGQNLVSGDKRNELPAISAVPLPMSAWMLLAALAGLLGLRRRKFA
ncbi:MAG: hypothetical protein AAFR93_10415 [Pseudomonadota bacterium]